MHWRTLVSILSRYSVPFLFQMQMKRYCYDTSIITVRHDLLKLSGKENRSLKSSQCKDIPRLFETFQEHTIRDLNDLFKSFSY